MAAATLSKPKKVDVIDVVRHGEKIVIPEGMAYKDVLTVVQQKMDYDEEVVALSIPIDGYFLFDALVAFHHAIADKYGWASMVPTPGFFGPTPPTMIGVEVGLGETLQVPWGSIALPHVEGLIATGATRKDGRLVFQISGKIKRKHEHAVDDLVSRTKQRLKTDSIYRGQAIRIRFKDDDGDELAMPEPKFLDLRAVREDELIYSDEVMTQVKTNIWTPIERSEYCKSQGVPLKRGILLAGPFGVGKSLTSFVTAKKCVENGWTYIAVDRADELADVLRFAHLYGPSVVFCEDIDRVMRGERTITSDEMLNLVDGIESKSTDLMVIFTTNEVDQVQQALLRPGRLDAVINVTPPDAKAAEKLIRKYGRGLVPEDEDLTKVGRAVAGQNAAAIREIVERAKLYAISLMEDEGPLTITAAALLSTAHGMQEHLRLLQPKEEDKRTPIEKAAGVLAQARIESTKMLSEGGRGLLEDAEDLTLVGATVAPGTGASFNGHRTP